MRMTQVSSGLIATQTLTSFDGVAVLRERLAGKRHAHAECETAAGGRGRTDDELAAGEVLAFAECHFSHGALPQVLLPVVVPPAAMWTASRMR